MRSPKDQVMLKIHPHDDDVQRGPYFVGPFDNTAEADLWARLNIWNAGYDFVRLINYRNAKDGRF